jgi:hypothetical protein
MRLSFVSISFTIALLTLTPASAQEIPERYVIREGKMNGLAETPPVTILLDTETGRSWFLGVIEGSPQWLPLVFSERVPDHVLPPRMTE